MPTSDRNQLQNLLKYLFRAPIALKHLRYEETTGRVTYSVPRGAHKTWPHPYDFLADFIQHLPPPRKPQITQMGWFANATGNLKSRCKSPQGADPTPPKRSRRSRWAQRVLRVWQVDPTLCPRCQRPMTRSKALLDWKELERVLRAIGLLGYPPRPPPVPPPDLVWPETTPAAAGACDRRGPGIGVDPGDDISQIPPGWEDQL